MTGTATFVKQRNGNGEGRIYRVDPPIQYAPTHDSWDTSEYVWVSATVAPFTGPETYIFASDANGEVLDWGELAGSYRGGLDHVAALRGAGYEVAE